MPGRSFAARIALVTAILGFVIVTFTLAMTGISFSMAGQETRMRDAITVLTLLFGLDPDQCVVLLRGKGETVRWQPRSPPALIGRLIEHGRERHAPPDG